jgi:ferritin-like metal-binding protein YciE
MDDFKALLVQQLEDINDAEKQWLEAVPGFTQAAHSPALRQALAAEGERARGDSGRIRSAFQLLGVNPSVRVSKGMRGLVEAARGATSAANGFSAPVADAALVAEVQKIKH